MKPFKPYLNQPRWCGADRQKVPYNPKTGNRARPNDLSTFATFKEAKALLRSRQTITSLGLRTGDGIVAFDFDGVVNADGSIDPYAIEVMKMLGSYNEVSLSGTGIKTICRYEGSQTSGWSFSPGGSHKEFALLNFGRYTILTGNQISPEGVSGELFDLLGGPAELALITDDEMAAIKAIARKRAGQGTRATSNQRRNLDLSGSGHAFRFALRCRKEGLSQSEFIEKIEDDDGEAGAWWGRADDRQRERVWSNCESDYALDIEAMNAEFAHVMIGGRSRIVWFSEGGSDV